jgi:Cdc6-like AAA superfamily ATPase
VIAHSTIINNRRLSDDFQDAPETADTPDSGLLTQEETDSFTPRRARKALQFSDDENNDDNDNDHLDNQSVGSSESDSSLSSQESIMLTLAERRLQNDERNAKFLSHLDSKYEKVVPKAKTKETDKEADEEVMEEESPQNDPPRGMQIKMNTSIDLQTNDSTLTPTNVAKSLQTRFPHRESQIRLLTSLLSATMTQARRYSPDSGISAYVPAPIFVTGPSGTGKTAICRDVVDALDKTATGVASAYVNCAILEPSSIDRLVSSAYGQLIPIELEENPKPRRRKRKHKSVSTKEVPAKVQAVSNAEDTVTGDSQENGKYTTTEETEGSKVQKSTESGATDAPIDTEVPNQDEEKDEHDTELNKRTQPGRRAKVDNIPTGSAQVAGKENVKKFGSIVAKSNAASGKVESSWATHTAVVALGRALKPYYGRESKSCAFLVLDHAERLLSLSIKKSGNEQTNYLAELLLLPKVMELNLTIIVITNNCVLDSSRKFLYWGPRMSLYSFSRLRS